MVHRISAVSRACSVITNVPGYLTIFPPALLTWQAKAEKMRTFAERQRALLARAAQEQAVASTPSAGDVEGGAAADAAAAAGDGSPNAADEAAAGVAAGLVDEPQMQQLLADELPEGSGPMQMAVVDAAPLDAEE